MERGCWKTGMQRSLDSGGGMTCADPRSRFSLAGVNVQGPTHDSLAKSSFHNHVQVTCSEFGCIYLSISTKGTGGVLGQLYVHRENEQDNFVVTYPNTCERLYA